MEDHKKKAMEQIGKLWSLADHIENALIDTETAGKLFDVIYAKADEIADQHKFTEQDLADFEQARRDADVCMDDRLQVEFERRVAEGENPLDISFG